MHSARRLVIELDEPLDVHGAIERLALVASLLQALAMAILAGGIAWIVVRRMLGRPLSALADYARKIGRGELDERTTVHSRNEVGVLAAEMNAMAGQLSAARRALEEAATERVFLQESLRHGDRLRTVGQLAASLAHELGTPLNTVLGHGRMIERRTEPDDPTHTSAKMIIEQAQRMAGLIRELLDFGRKKTSERVPQDVVLLVQKTWHLLEPIARKTGAEFVLDAPSAARARVDGGQLLQVLTNLVMNAMQSMPRGGVVRARVRVDDVDPPAEVRARGARYVHVAIEDHGSGIAQEDLQRVFEPFFTSKGEGEGTGLGLSVAEGIVRAHDGWISIESTVGQGTTVHVFLPSAG
jgi:signal transduction histidine kinase